MEEGGSSLIRISDGIRLRLAVEIRAAALFRFLNVPRITLPIGDDDNAQLDQNGMYDLLIGDGGYYQTPQKHRIRILHGKAFSLA